MAEFRTEDLFVSLGQVIVGGEGGEEWQVPFVVLVFFQLAADQLKGRTQIRLPQLIDKVVQFLAHRAHSVSLPALFRLARVDGRTARILRCHESGAGCRLRRQTDISIPV